jgi:hypothetical protein
MLGGVEQKARAKSERRCDDHVSRRHGVALHKSQPQSSSVINHLINFGRAVRLLQRPVVLGCVCFHQAIAMSGGRGRKKFLVAQA